MAKKKVNQRSPLDALSPVIIAQLKYPEEAKKAERQKYQQVVTKEVRKCKLCNLRKKQGEGCKPVPFVTPKKPKFVVVGEAPGPRESLTGKPFVGPAGNLFRSLMNEVGIDPVKDVHWVNSISCFPTEDGTTLRPRPKPTDEERRACFGNLINQVSAAYVPYVLLVGATAFNTFRSDLNVTNHHGKFFVWNDSYVVMGLIHPASVLRGSSGYKKLIREDLLKWRDVVYGDDNPLLFLGDLCIKCEQPAVLWDRDGVPWCRKHEGFKGVWEKERSRWAQALAVQLTIY